MEMKLNEKVRTFWEKEPCGTGVALKEAIQKNSKEWFERIEELRYQTEPFIHSIAQFTRSHGKRILEVGVGAGTDHLQWARAGAECFGVDLTDAAIESTRELLERNGLSSSLQRIDAESLPFPEDHFDLVYSWGVIHHSENPKRIIREIRRVLKKNGTFVGMMYGRRSFTVFKLWLKYALFAGRPWRTFADIVWNHVESIGTKAYTVHELRMLFSEFGHVDLQPTLTIYDTHHFPSWLSQFFPNRWGWFIAIRATK